MCHFYLATTESPQTTFPLPKFHVNNTSQRNTSNQYYIIYTLHFSKTIAQMFRVTESPSIKSLERSTEVAKTGSFYKSWFLSCVCFFTQHEHLTWFPFNWWPTSTSAFGRSHHCKIYQFHCTLIRYTMNKFNYHVSSFPFGHHSKLPTNFSPSKLSY